MTQKQYTHTRGFTLIEMLVSVALFSVVMVVALGALLAMSAATRKAESVNTAVNNIAAAVDSMTRSIRTGQDYHCGNSGTLTTPLDCPWSSNAPQPYFTYLAFGGARVTYCLSMPGMVTACNSGVTCGTGGACAILRKVDNGSYIPLTAPDINITKLAFYAEGTLPSSISNDQKQPKVTMVVVGTVPVSATVSTAFNIQTSVTQRIFDQ